uniref:Uncharacterized protein n=1 Tax=Rhizophora mucronata TaxID=61149 RepID=A0A2P2MW37_RHIMU
MQMKKIRILSGRNKMNFFFLTKATSATKLFSKSSHLTNG